MARLVIGITGASGSSIAVKALQLAQEQQVETHLVVSSWGLVNLKHETGMTENDLKPLATHTHSNRDLASEIASGSYRVDATIIVPCSARTLGTIANGIGDTLISRSADVALKERRPLVLALRESPLSPIHLRNALHAAEAGAFVAPLSPAFYTRPESMDELFTIMAARLLDHAGIDSPALPRWGEDLSLKQSKR